MGKLNKFESVDVTASLEAIMKQNTAFYQSDFDIDKEIIKRAAESPNAGDKMLLWFSRPSGTCCIKERDAFLKDTREHNTWKFYGEQTRDRVLAYAVELTGIQDGKITGNLYELDYQQHYKHVTEQALPADNYMLIYEHGEREQPAARPFDASPNPQLGKFERFEAIPNDPEALQSLLREERRSREQSAVPGDLETHTAALRDGLIETEARRIVGKMKELSDPNSPDKSHFMVELSPYFTQIATTKDTDRLFSMLPYKTLSFSQIKDRHGTYALIGKDENRDRQIRKPRPSVRAQLAQDKKKNRPEKGGGKKERSRIGGMSMNKYNNFTVEETNLLSIYMTGSKEGLVVAMNAALPFMDGEMRDFAARTLAKVGRMTEAEFAGLALYPADEV